jgi:steroid 5-alpha reductase family enzyme
MTFLLVKVSGVAMIERSMESRPGYEEYQKNTSTFFPWFPNK